METGKIFQTIVKALLNRSGWLVLHQDVRHIDDGQAATIMIESVTVKKDRTISLPPGRRFPFTP